MNTLQGHLLVAAPQLLDPNFFHTVVLMVQHDEQGALGLVLNRPTETAIEEAWPEVSDTPCHAAGPIYAGGPVEGPLMVLHTLEEAAQIEILPGVYFSAEAESVAWLAGQAQQAVKFFVGYAGWSPGQLEGELAGGSWLVLPARAGHVFTREAGDWETVAQEIAQVLRNDDGETETPRVDPSLN